MEPLIENVASSKQGCHVAGKCCAIFIYADDVLLIAPTRRAMQNLLVICENFAQDFYLRYNLDKCKVILFLTSNRLVQPFILNNVPLKFTTNEKHLGHVLSNNHDLIDFAKVVSDLKCKANVLFREFSFLDHSVKSKLFNTNCTSLYGIPLLDLSSHQFEHVCTAWRVSIKCVLQLNMRTRSNLLPHLVKSPSAEKIIHSRFMSFFLSGLRHSNEFISTIFNHTLNSHYSYFRRNLSYIFYHYGLNWNTLSNMSDRDVKSYIRNYNCNVDWRVNIIKELMMIRDHELFGILEPQEVTFMLNTVCTA